MVLQRRRGIKRNKLNQRAMTKQSRTRVQLGQLGAGMNGQVDHFCVLTVCGWSAVLLLQGFLHANPLWGGGYPLRLDIQLQSLFWQRANTQNVNYTPYQPLLIQPIFIYIPYILVYKSNFLDMKMGSKNQPRLIFGRTWDIPTESQKIAKIHCNKPSYKVK